MYQLSLFGAATEKLMQATIDGDLRQGVQFVGEWRVFYSEFLLLLCVEYVVLCFDYDCVVRLKSER